MASRGWMLLVAMAALPAIAEDVPFQGHVVEVDGRQPARPVQRVTGTVYSIPGSASQIVGKAELCLSPQKAGTGAIQSVDRDNGVLLAAARAAYRYKGRTESVDARLAVEAGAGSFRLVFTDLALSRDGAAAGPVLQQDGSGWDKSLAAVIGVEQAVLDCMFR